ncbi:MAG: hypothetical protein V7655_10550 [Aequorivita antarctica]
MEELFEIWSYTILALYALVFCLSIIKFQSYRHSPLMILPIILFITLMAESLGMYFRDVLAAPNIGIFNTYYFFYFSLFYFLFMKVIEEQRFKKFIKIGIGIFWMFYLRDLIFIDILNESFTASYIAGAGILIFCITLYYISILQSSKVLVVKNDLLFWISVGLFLFYIGYLPIKIIRSWFYKENSFFWILLIIQFSLIVVMYLCFLIGFLWMKKRS